MASSASKACQIFISTRSKLFAFIVDVNLVKSGVCRVKQVAHLLAKHAADAESPPTPQQRQTKLDSFQQKRMDNSTSNKFKHTFRTDKKCVINLQLITSYPFTIMRLIMIKYFN